MVGTGIFPNNMRPPLPSVTRHSGWWPYTVTPSIDRTLHQFLTVTDLDLNYLIKRGFHGTFSTGAACQQRTLTPPVSWPCSTLGLACVLMSRPISPEPDLFTDFWISNNPRYFSFACKRAKSFSVSKPLHQSDILVCLHCWQTGKGFQLP